MGNVKTKGAFEHIVCSTPTFKSLLCITKDVIRIEVNFDDLEITPKGTVLIYTKNRTAIPGTKRNFVTLSRILPASRDDEKYFDFVSNEIKKIEQKFQSELKQKQKQKRDRRKMTV